MELFNETCSQVSLPHADDKLIHYLSKFKTKWKYKLSAEVKICVGVIMSIIVVLTIFSVGVDAGPAKVILYRGLKKDEVSIKQCRAGVYTKIPMMFTCACVTGV